MTSSPENRLRLANSRAERRRLSALREVRAETSWICLWFGVGAVLSIVFGALGTEIDDAVRALLVVLGGVGIALVIALWRAREWARISSGCVCVLLAITYGISAIRGESDWFAAGGRVMHGLLAFCWASSAWWLLGRGALGRFAVARERRSPAADPTPDARH